MSSTCQWCRSPRHMGGCDREALKEQIRVLRLEADARKKLVGPEVIWVNSLVSHRTQKPKIDIQLGEVHTQMSTDAAIDLARNIIEVCAGAWTDSFIFNFMKERVGLDDERGVQIIQDFRRYREELAKEFKQQSGKEG